MWSTLEGSFIGGRYSIVQHIATGGMAAVFRGWDHRIERPVAIKVLRQLESADERAIARFQREAHATAMLDHPHVVRVFDFFEDQGCSYLVMEFIQGMNLKQHVRRRGRLAAREALGIADQVCSALQAAHEHGFIHRDIKPQNVLLDERGTAKLTDFGIVYIAQGGTLTSRGLVMGTADYIAPEQARGEALTAASDLYSLGVVLYEMLTGRLPFTAATPVAVATQHATAPVPPPSRLVPTLSPYVEAIVLRAMRKCPESRYRSAMAMGLALRLVQQASSSVVGEPTAASARASREVAVSANALAMASVAAESGLAPAGTAGSVGGTDPGSSQTPADAPAFETPPADVIAEDVGTISPSLSDVDEVEHEVDRVDHTQVRAPRPLAMLWWRIVLVALVALALAGGILLLEASIHLHAAMGML
jgi:serine/threonine protein kinase